MEILDLYDNNFNKLDKTIIRRVDEIPNNTNIMLSYAIIKMIINIYLNKQLLETSINGVLLVDIYNIMKMP